MIAATLDGRKKFGEEKIKSSPKFVFIGQRGCRTGKNEYKLLMDMRKTARYLIGAAMMSMAVPTAFSQSVGIKTNLVNDALLSPNLGLEIGLAPKWTL